MSSNLEYPEVFITGKCEYKGHPERKKMAIADALCAWGNVFAGEKPPKNFGTGMAELAGIVGKPLTPENCDRLAKEAMGE